MTYQTVRGMRDLLPSQVKRLRAIEDKFRETVEAAGYEEIRIPIVEYKDLFVAAGETSKQMYEFTDKGDRTLVLRPEGTTSVARAYINNPQELSGTQKLWYNSPMFRYERPQRGRYRQFTQLGIEYLGVQSATADAEVIKLAAKLCGDRTVSLNYLGSDEERSAYVEKLVSYLEQYRDDLDPVSQQNLTSNPLRILDSKNKQTRKILETSPKLLDSLGDDSRSYLDSILSELGDTSYVVDLDLVRGLDYYTGIVFEIVINGLAVCGGGRYDNLIESLGGQSTPAVGMAIGLDRLEILKEE